MGKKSRRRVKPAKPESMPFVARTFEALPGECDWVAFREIVPAATATVTLKPEVGTDRAVRVCSLLPGGAPGLVRPDGTIWLGLQVQHNFGDISRDLAAVVEKGLEAEPGSEIALVDPPGVGRRLQDLVDPASSFDVEVHEGFDYWVDGADGDDAVIAQALEAANAAAAPTVRLDSVDAAYWTTIGGRRYLRWAQPHAEDEVLNALARLHVRAEGNLGDRTRLIGMFRAHGLLVPVWEADDAVDAGALEVPATEWKARFNEVLGDESDLTSEQRSARNGLANRQLTIR